MTESAVAFTQSPNHIWFSSKDSLLVHLNTCVYALKSHEGEFYYKIYNYMQIVSFTHCSLIFYSMLWFSL